MLTMTTDAKCRNAAFQASYKKMLTEEREASSTKYIDDLQEGDKFKFKIDQKVYNGNTLRFLDTGNLEDEYPIHQLKWTKRVFNPNNTADKSNTDNFYAFINGVFTVRSIDKTAMTLETPPLYFLKISAETDEVAQVSSVDSVGAGMLIFSLPKDKVAVEIVKKSTKASEEEMPIEELPPEDEELKGEEPPEDLEEVPPEVIEKPSKKK